MPLLKNGTAIEDAFTTVADDAPLPDSAVIVSLKRFLAEKDALFARPHPLGVEIATGDDLSVLGDDVHRFGAVAIRLPLFKDGRVFTRARVLRTRLGYAGEIRATGHFLIDQIAFLMRVGVDAFDLPETITVPDAVAASRAMSNVYQPAPDHRQTIGQMRSGLASR